MLRGLATSSGGNNNDYYPLVPLQNPCVVALIEVLHLDGHHEPPIVACVLQGSDMVRFSNDFEYFIEGLDSNFAEQNNLVSYGSTLSTEGALIDHSTKKIYFPWDAGINIGEVDPRDRRRLVASTGNQTLLVIRIECNDSVVTANEAEISDNIFGNGVDTFNYKSQTEECSFGQHTISKASDHIENTTIANAIGSDSVYTVQLNISIINETSMGLILAAAETQFEDDLDVAVNDLADLVMLCFPPGMNKSWVAFAVSGGWKSWYWDGFCASPSAMMHEVGHNMGLGHSGVPGGSEYADTVGFMGFSSGADDAPARCFNAPKTYQLNW